MTTRSSLPHPRMNRWPLGALLCALGACDAPPAPITAPSGVTAEAIATSTVVSLTFDDALADQDAARAILAAHGFHATFYVISGRVGTSGHLTWSQLDQLAAEGHEIAGHTVDHLNLTTLTTDQQQQEICHDRVVLLDAGFPITSFAYPFGATNDGIERIVDGCGYNSGRGVGGVRTPWGCSGCPPSESIPPGDPYRIRTPDSIKSWMSLADLQHMVTQAEGAGGGWVPLVIHHVCDGCDQYSISPSTLEAFLAWLEPRAGQGTVVRTVHQVIGGDVRPGVDVPPPPPPPVGLALQNPSLEADADGDGVPDCWQLRRYGTNSGTAARSTDAHGGAYSELVTVTSWTSGESKFVSRQDSACAPSGTMGHLYRVSAWYKSSAPVRFVAYYLGSDGHWAWWAQSQDQPAAGSWTNAAWSLPSLPAGASLVSVGMEMHSTGWFRVDDLSLVDLTP